MGMIMKKVQVSLVAFGVLCIAAGITGASRARDAQPSGPALVIRNARVFDGERVHDNASVVVRGGRIAAIGASVDVPAGATVIDGAGKTLLPGLIDAHTHAFNDALARALVFGVTTELDMFTSHQAAAGWRAEQASAAGAPLRADIVSAVMPIAERRKLS
jgi:hypothetical protein